jgi:hypothetical protein
MEHAELPAPSRNVVLADFGEAAELLRGKVDKVHAIGC